MIKTKTRIAIFVVLTQGWLISQSQDFDGLRPTGSSTNGINIANFYNTNIQLTAHTHSASHGILFNSYKPLTTVSGSLGTAGNTKHSQGAGTYSGGAGAVMFYGNGGTMQFLISETSPGAHTDVVWGAPKMTIKKNGYVGIGTSSPTSPLHIYLPVGVSAYPSTSTKGDIIQELTSNNNNFEIGVARASNERKAWILARHSSNGYGKYYSTLHLQPDVGDKSQYRGVAVGYAANSDVSIGTHLAVEGNVGIGTATPTEKLEVNGTIRSKEVKVEASPWPDYVFEPNYDLRSLEEIEKFIQSNKHLPEIPSKEEIEANGLQLGEMNRLLLKKIEELTLYMIQQQKLIESQGEQIKELRTDLNYISHD